MKKVRIGVIGCGVMGPKHVQAAADLPLTEPFAVADLIPERAQAVAAKFGLTRVYRQGSDLIKDPDVDAVVLAFPAQHRTALALKAFAAGKHVLIEKPVAPSAAHVRRMIQARGNLTAGCCSLRFRCLPQSLVIRDFLAKGYLGQLRLLRARQLQACGKKPEKPRPDWRLTKALNGGGILFNWGCYDIDYLLGLVGWSLRPRTVFAQAWPISPHLLPHIAPGSDAETYYTALVRCDDGVTISLERGEFMPADDDAAWQIIGERGSLRMVMTPAKGKKLIHDDTTTEGGVTSRVLWEGDEEFGGPAGKEPMRDFAQAILDGRQTDTSLERSLVVQQISDAIIASAARGKAVTIR